MFEELLVQAVSTSVTRELARFMNGEEIERTYHFDTMHTSNSIAMKAKLDRDQQHATASLKIRTRLI